MTIVAHHLENSAPRNIQSQISILGHNTTERGGKYHRRGGIHMLQTRPRPDTFASTLSSAAPVSTNETVSTPLKSQSSLRIILIALYLVIHYF